jgi:hypothetical protein
MASINHVHTYVFLHKKHGTQYFKCDDPHCTHFASRDLIRDKASICSKCRNTEIILDWKALRRKRPLCLNCADTAEARQFRKTKEIMENLLSGGPITNGDDNNSNITPTRR